MTEIGYIRCQICRSLVKKIKKRNHALFFIQNDKVLEKRRICGSCFNKILVKMREDTMPEDYLPESMSQSYAKVSHKAKTVVEKLKKSKKSAISG